MGISVAITTGNILQCLRNSDAGLLHNSNDYLLPSLPLFLLKMRVQ